MCIRDRSDELRVDVKATAGSAANLRLLSENFLQVGIAQSDTLLEMCIRDRCKTIELEKKS